MRTKFISDDGKVESDDRTEVERYEAGLNPLAKFGFPLKHMATCNWASKTGIMVYGTEEESDGLIRFINLVPLIEELRKETLACRMKDFHDWEDDADEEDRALSALLLAYEKALEESK